MAATARRSSEATFNGAVKKFLDHTTPAARTNEASRLFLIVQPPLLLRRGVHVAAQPCLLFKTLCYILPCEET